MSGGLFGGDGFELFDAGEGVCELEGLLVAGASELLDLRGMRESGLPGFGEL